MESLFRIFPVLGLPFVTSYLAIVEDLSRCVYVLCRFEFIFRGERLLRYGIRGDFVEDFPCAVKKRAEGFVLVRHIFRRTVRGDAKRRVVSADMKAFASVALNSSAIG